MIIRVNNNRFIFELELHDKYTIIRGNSGTGKTSFYNLVEASMGKFSGVNVKSPLPLRVVYKKDSVNDLKEENVIYVVDEHCNLIKELNKLSGINAYFILLFRDDYDKQHELKQLSVSVTSVYEFVWDGTKTVTKNLYSKFNQTLFGQKVNC